MKKKMAAAFSLIELLVSVAVIGMLLSLAFPALLSTRETVRRNSCSNKIRQLALAVNGFETARGHYPLSRFVVPESIGPTSYSWSWLSQVQPFLEDGGIVGDSRSLTLGEVNAISSPVSAFICPSDPLEENVRLGAGHFEEWPLAVTNYKGNMGSNWGVDQTLETPSMGSRWRHQGFNGSYDGQAKGDGMMWRDDAKARMRPAKVKDGLSKTFLIGEDLPAYNRWNSWAYANHAYGTCAIPLNYNRADPYWWPDAQSFRSAHTEGANFGYGDGHVEFISNDISLAEYRRRASRQDSP